MSPQGRPRHGGPLAAAEALERQRARPLAPRRRDLRALAARFRAIAAVDRAEALEEAA